MGTVAEKLSYLADTKDLFKDRLNSLGAEILNTTTFRNYLNWLDTFYGDVSNKTDLAKNGVVGRTSQDGDPTPENPVEINNLSGDVEYKVRGKNLFDKDTIINGYVNAGGGITNLDGYKSSAYIEIKPNVSYYKSQSGSTRWKYYDENKNVYSSETTDLSNASNEQIFITPSNVKYLRFTMSNDLVDSFILCEGTTTTPYEPYISESFPLSLKSRNLFDESLITSIGGTIKYIPINVKKNTDYTLSTNSGTSTLANVFLSTTNSRVTTNNNGAMIDHPRTINSGDNNIMYVGYRNDLSSYWIQLEEGSTATTYEPYYDIELCSISDYKDRIYSQNGEFYLEKKTGKVVLDGSENVSRVSTNISGTYRFSITGPTDMKKNVDVALIPAGLVISNKFVEISNSDSYNVVSINGILVRMNNTNSFIINCIETQTYTVEQFKTWLSTHNTEAEYVLATTTTTEITQENYPTLYSQLLAIQEFLTKYKINKEFLLDYSSPEIEY